MKQTFKQLFNFVLLSSLSFSVLAEVMVVDGYVRAMPPSVPNTAAYLTIENHGPDTRLVAVKTSFAKEAQLHTIIEEDGMVKMRQVKGFDILSHGSLTLKESGNHIMLLGLTQPLPLETQVGLVLIFADGTEQSVTLQVKKSANFNTDADEQLHHNHH